MKRIIEFVCKNTCTLKHVNIQEYECCKMDRQTCLTYNENCEETLYNKIKMQR